MGALILLLGACAAPRVQRPPELEAAHRRVEKNAADGDGYVALARLYFQRQDLLRARQYLVVSEKLPVSDPRERARLGLFIIVRSGQYEEAVVRCRKMLEQREEPRLHQMLAVLYESLGRFPEAEVERRLLTEQVRGPEGAEELIEMARFYERWRAGGQPVRAGALVVDPRATALYQRYLQVAPGGEHAPQARTALRAQALSSPAAPMEK